MPVRCGEEEPAIGARLEPPGFRVLPRVDVVQSPAACACAQACTAATGLVAVRDSKDVPGPELEFSGQAWTDFVQGIKSGEFGL